MKLILSLIAVILCSFVISYSYAEDVDSLPEGDKNLPIKNDTPTEARSTAMGAESTASCPYCQAQAKINENTNPSVNPAGSNSNADDAKQNQ